MTPRSRQPIIINSSSSLPSIPVQEKTALFQENECSDEAISSKVPTKGNSFRKDKSVLKFSEVSTLGSVFKCLSTVSLMNLITKLEYSNSTLEENGDSALINCSNCNDTLQNDTLTSVFKEYLLSRSILTDNLANSSSDSILTETDNSSNNISMNDSFQSVLKNFSYQSPLSQSLLFCLDGNNPSQFHSTPKNIFSSKDAKSQSLRKKSSSSSSDQRNSTSEDVVMNEYVGSDESAFVSFQEQDSNLY